MRCRAKWSEGVGQDSGGGGGGFQCYGNTVTVQKLLPVIELRPCQCSSSLQGMANGPWTFISSLHERGAGYNDH